MKKTGKTVLDLAKRITGLQKVVYCEDCGEIMYVRATSTQRLCRCCKVKRFAERTHTQEAIDAWTESHSSHAKSYHKKGSSKYVHREIAEEMLGRPLRSDEIVHHRDKNIHNNSPENLMVMTRSEHTKLHHKERREQKAQEQLVLACATI